MSFSMLYQSSVKIENLTDSPDEWIARAQQGDREAFGLIFTHHHRFIYKFIFAMVGQQSLAEELTQETFLGAFKGINSIRGESKLRTWLCGIAKNTVYKFFRSQGKQTAQTENEIESLNVIDDKNSTPDRQFLRKELNQAIQTALETLDEDKRLIFTLKELQHLSYQEISEITGYSIPKLKTDLHRAKKQMRNALHPYLEVNNEL